MLTRLITALPTIRTLMALITPIVAKSSLPYRWEGSAAAP